MTDQYECIRSEAISFRGCFFITGCGHAAVERAPYKTEIPFSIYSMSNTKQRKMDLSASQGMERYTVN